VTLGQLKESKSTSKGNPPLCLGAYAGGNDIRFALYRRQALTQSLPCMILFLVHETTNAARIVAQDQNGTALMEVAGTLQSTPVFTDFCVDFLLVQPQVDARTEGSSLMIDAENITFTTPKGTVSLPQHGRRCSARN
jgi:hypothetical protein